MINPIMMGKSVFTLRLKSEKRSAIAETSFSYIPSMAATDPPENPGIIKAMPIKNPLMVSKSSPKKLSLLGVLDKVIFSAEFSDNKSLFFFIFIFLHFQHHRGEDLSASSAFEVAALYMLEFYLFFFSSICGAIMSPLPM